MPAPYRGVGEDKAVRVGDNLQEDVHLVQDVGQTFILLFDNLERIVIWGWLEHHWGDHTVLKVSTGPCRLWRCKICPYLLGEPNAACLCHPFTGVDASVNPNGRAIRATFTELELQKWGNWDRRRTNS